LAGTKQTARLDTACEDSRTAVDCRACPRSRPQEPLSKRPRVAQDRSSRSGSSRDDQFVEPGRSLTASQHVRVQGYDSLGTSTTQKRLPSGSSKTTKSSRSEEHTSELQSRENLVC